MTRAAAQTAELAFRKYAEEAISRPYKRPSLYPLLLVAKECSTHLHPQTRILNFQTKLQQRVVETSKNVSESLLDVTVAPNAGAAQLQKRCVFLKVIDSSQKNVFDIQNESNVQSHVFSIFS